MKDESNSSFDRISQLPSNILHIILMFLPLRDMGRTSVLSKSWRYEWLKVPQLVFKNDRKYWLSREEKYRYDLMKVYRILLLHMGPIFKFTLDMNDWDSGDGIDEILIYLSRNGIKELTLEMPDYDSSPCHIISSCILSCVELRHLTLYNCVFQPLTFVGFRNLLSLELWNIKLFPEVSISSCPLLESLKLSIICSVERFSVDAPNLKILFFDGCFYCIGYMNTPLLQVLSLEDEELEEHLWENSKFDLLKLIQIVPLLENLHVSHRFLKFFDVGDSLNEFTSMLTNLKVLLTGTTSDLNDLSATLWLIRNSPNLQKLELELPEIDMTTQVENIVEAELYLKMQDRSHYSLLKLQEMLIILDHPCRGLEHDIKFIKFLLDISPELETIYIEPYLGNEDVGGVYERLTALSCYPRASPKSRLEYVGCGMAQYK